MNIVLRLILGFTARSLGQSYVTSIVGYLGLAVAVFLYVSASIDGNPLTTPNWEEVLAAAGSAGFIAYEKPKKEPVV